MAGASDFLALAGKLQTAAATLPAAALKGVVAAAALMEGAVAVAAGGYRGSKLVRTKTTLTPVPTPIALVRMPSRKAHLLDHDTKAHPIGPKQATTLVIWGRDSKTPIAGAVNHPGTRGKLIWEEALAVAEPKMSGVVAQSISTAFVKAFL